MACIISIDTSTTVCSVALSQEGTVLYDKRSYQQNSHATVIGTFVEEALKILQEKGCLLDAVAVSSGPGSYTGLRIGVSIAKGICFGKQIPLIAIPTLKIIAAQAIERGSIDWLYVPMIDAHRMEVYSAVYDANLQTIRPLGSDIVEEDTYASYIKEKTVCFCGNGADKCKEIICSDSHENIHFLGDIQPIAKSMVSLAERAYEEKDFADVAYFTPNYLKEYRAIISKNKVLGC